ncbi:hypothetical protein ARSEF1564_001585 [Beauveria bassiana]
MSAPDVKEDAYPARSQKVNGVVNGTPTEVISTSYSDRILVTVQVPLTPSAAGSVDMTLPAASHGLLPSTHLTPTTLLGGGGEERETIGQLYAAQIASFLSLRYPDDRRTLVVGFGLKTIDKEREAFFDLFELAQKVL